MTLTEGDRIGGLIHLSTTVSLLHAREAVAHLTKAETNAEGGPVQL